MFQDHKTEFPDEVPEEDAASVSEIGLVRQIPEAALLRAAHEMSLASGQLVSLTDYTSSVAVLFSELARYAWKLSPSSNDIRSSETSASPTYSKSIPLAQLIEKRRHG